MPDQHLAQAAVLVEQADQPRWSNQERGLLLLEALVHAVLHLADVVDIRETITSP